MRLRCLLLLGLGLAGAPVGLAQDTLTNQHLFDTIPFLPGHYAQRKALFAQQPARTGRILFLGDSITEGGPWHRLLGDSTVINQGIGGDITFGVLQRLDEVVRHRPTRLFLLIGINDIGKDIPVAVIADNVRKIIEQVQRRSPETQVFLQSVLPVNADYPGFPQHYDKEHQVLRLNPLLRAVAVARGCTFINLYPLLLDAQERLDARYTGDGLHLNEAGYAVWVQYLREAGYL
jgi:lysophospholipase L1-like esterase